MRVSKRFEMGRQIGTAAFLAGFDQHHAAGVAHAAGLCSLDRQERGKGRVAVVGTATSIEAIAFDHRLPRPEIRPPAGHLRLLVEVSVEQGSVVIRSGSEGRDLHHDHRCAFGQLVDLDGEPGDCPIGAPGPDQFDSAIHVAVLAPLRVVQGRHVGDGDVLVERRNDVVGPDAVDVGRHGVAHRRAPSRRSMIRSASATIDSTSSPAGISDSIAPTPCPQGMNSRAASTSVPSG